MSIEIIEAQLTNATHATAIVDVLDTYASDPVGGSEPLTADVRARLVASLVEHGRCFVLLAFDGTDAVGVAICFYGVSTFKALPLLNIHDIAVIPDRRGHGIGRSLLAAAEERARADGCCKLTLEVLDSNHRARGLYESFGFRDFLLGGDAVTRFLEKPLS